MPRAHTGETPKAKAREYDDEQLAAEIAADLEEGSVSRNPLNNKGRGSFMWMGSGPKNQSHVAQWGGGKGPIVSTNPVHMATLPGHP